MVYRFILVSDESEDFRRDIKIDSEATFFELHEAVLNSVKYTKDQITSFFICDEDWIKRTEITLIDMGSSSEDDVYVMESCRLSELIDEEKQRLVYVFEPLTERCFFMELREIITGEELESPKIVKAVGEPPVQITAFEDVDFSAPVNTIANNIDEDFLDDEFDSGGYNDEDFSDLSDDVFN
ncbi:hypothetical protein M2138_000450 [Dysgonomonadaceae bacterium PH5-43]|nr:hypothetical protein [Dysgonomonadaceae bacterium PH5-43]